jgi:hypothetical protein
MVIVGLPPPPLNNETLRISPPLTSPLVQIAARLMEVTVVTTAERRTTPNPEAERWG